MAKDPAFLFYPNDYLGDTFGLKLEQKGAYMDLRVLQFNHGPFTDEMAVNVTSEECWSKIKRLFAKTQENTYYHEKTAIEIQRRAEFSNSRRKNRKGNKNQTTCDFTSDNTHVPTHDLTTEQHLETATVTVTGTQNIIEERPIEILKKMMSIRLEEMNMKSGMTVDDFNHAVEQWSLSIEGKEGDDAFIYTGTQQQAKSLFALLQKWINTWARNERNGKFANKKTIENGKRTEKHGRISDDDAKEFLNRRD